MPSQTSKLNMRQTCHQAARKAITRAVKLRMNMLWRKLMKTFLHVCHCASSPCPIAVGVWMSKGTLEIRNGQRHRVMPEDASCVVRSHRLGIDSSQIVHRKDSCLPCKYTRYTYRDKQARKCLCISGRSVPFLSTCSHSHSNVFADNMTPKLYVIDI